MKSIKLTNLHKDVLKEIGNIGAGNATTSMSQLINQPVTMEVPSVEVVAVSEVIDMIGGPEEIIAASVFKIKGEITGSVYFVLSLEEAEYLVRQMTNNEEMKVLKDNVIDELAASCLQETANIMTGSYLSALADFTNLQMMTTAPFFSIDMAAATLVTGLVEISQVTDYALVIDTKITNNNIENAANGHFLLIPDTKSIPKLFKALGIDYDE